MVLTVLKVSIVIKHIIREELDILDVFSHLDGRTLHRRHVFFGILSKMVLEHIRFSVVQMVEN